MPRRDDADEVTEGAASATARGARAPRFGTRAHAPMTPPAPDRPDTPDDLRTALGTPDSFGVKLFEISVLQSILKACPDVKDAGDLLLLREILLEEFGPAYMWLINLSLVDWLSLSDDDKTLNAQMRLDWLASYSKASEAILQHWFWNMTLIAPVFALVAVILVDVLPTHPRAHQVAPAAAPVPLRVVPIPIGPTTIRRPLSNVSSSQLRGLPFSL